MRIISLLFFVFVCLSCKKSIAEESISPGNDSNVAA
jgi:hypothetical protein